MKKRRASIDVSQLGFMFEPRLPASMDAGLDDDRELTMTDRLAADARLLILKELAAQTDGRSNEIVLDRVLDAFGIRRSRAWLRTQLRALAELDAVRVEELGEVMIAGLRKAGRDHVERRSVIEGVSRPADAA